MTETPETEAKAGELLPCPFCGCKAKVFDTAGSYGYYSARTGICCASEKCDVHPSVSFDDERYDWQKRQHVKTGSEQKAIDAWNRRSPLTPQQQAD